MVINKDLLIGLIFILLCGVMFQASTQLPEPMFGQLASATWPRMILIPLGLLSLALVIRSQMGEKKSENISGSLIEWVKLNKTPFVCFFLFFLFLYTMPILGMLLGGLGYVFLTLTVLGGWAPKQLLQNACISIFFVIGMWALFTQVLGVLLPEGTLLRVY